MSGDYQQKDHNSDRARRRARVSKRGSVQRGAQGSPRSRSPRENRRSSQSAQSEARRNRQARQARDVAHDSRSAQRPRKSADEVRRQGIGAGVHGFNTGSFRRVTKLSEEEMRAAQLAEYDSEVEQGASAHSRDRYRIQPKKRKQFFVTRLVNQWFDRVMGAMKGEGLSNSEAQYASHRTTRDFVWNTAGMAAWSMVFPVVTMVSTQLVGVEQAGMISMAFIVALLLMFLGNFGVRTYQVSDVDEEHSFSDYQINRWVTCIIMIICGWAYCTARGYNPLMFNISMGVILYRCVDALADVFEGRLQQVDKLYLAGISQTLRSVLALIVFCVVLFITRNAAFACYGMAIVAAVTFVVVTWPLTLMETPRSRKFHFASFLKLFKMCAPLFLAIFLFNVIENMPKFVMEGSLPYDNQLYYNALYFPAQLILISAQLVYRPLLLRMAGVWQDDSKRRKFDLILVGIMLIIVAITAVVWIVMAWVGVPLLSLMYGINFEPYRGLMYVMLVTGGVTAAIDFLYQVITVMRRQRDVTTLYLVTFGFSLFIPMLLIAFSGLNGAILSYLIVEAILLVLLVWEYFRIRRDLAHGGYTWNDEVDSADYERPTFMPMDLGEGVEDYMLEGEAVAEGMGREAEQPAKKRPSEIRAEREFREDVMRRRTGK